MITPDNTAFIILSFEGPDGYCNAGGLGVRVTELSEALADEGYETQLHCVGDPDAPAIEPTGPNRTLFRWAQPVSRKYRGGVYDGEWKKIDDVNHCLPPRMADDLIPDLLSRRTRVAVLAEEWHTADTIDRLHERLWARGLRDRTIHFWNVNATFGLEHVDWWRLSYSRTTVTTVSRYMKFKLWDRGVDPLVIPNGIPVRMLEPVPKPDATRVRHAVKGDTVLTKVGRWDPNKRWLMAVEAVAQAKAAGLNPTLIVRGGLEPHEGDVLHRARELGLRTREVRLPAGARADFDLCVEAIAQTEPADLLVLRFFVPERLLRALYHVSDATLANSGHEPFGIVGLEVMACGGVAFTGSTGEEYARHLENAIVLDTSNPAEITHYLQLLKNDATLRKSLLAAGHRTAERFTWKNVIGVLNDKLQMVAAR